MIHVPKSRNAPFEFEGLRITDFGPGPEASASVAIVEVPGGARHREARSTRSDKYYLCQKGSIAFIVNGQKVELQTSDLLVISKGEWFSYTNTTNSEAGLLLIHVPPFDLTAEEFRPEPK